MRNSYVGADDITLLCPSIRGLNKMIDICNSFADMYDNTKFIKFGGQLVMSEILDLVKSRIEWVSNVKYLGNYVNSDRLYIMFKNCVEFNCKHTKKNIWNKLLIFLIYLAVYCFH